MSKQSICIKCGGSEFEIEKLKPNKAPFDFWAVQCASCGGVVSFLEAAHVEKMLEPIKQKLTQIENMLRAK